MRYVTRRFPWERDRSRRGGGGGGGYGAKLRPSRGRRKGGGGNSVSDTHISAPWRCKSSNPAPPQLDSWKGLLRSRPTTDSMPTCSEKMKLASSPTCNRGPEDQAAEHILLRCPLLQTARTNVWPTAVQLHAKLYVATAARRNWRRQLHSGLSV